MGILVWSAQVRDLLGKSSFWVTGKGQVPGIGFVGLGLSVPNKVCNHNNGGLWIQETYKLNATVLQEHRAARLEEEHLAEEDPTKLGAGAR
jgi:hypothetical protein